MKIIVLFILLIHLVLNHQSKHQNWKKSFLKTKIDPVYKLDLIDNLKAQDLDQSQEIELKIESTQKKMLTLFRQQIQFQREKKRFKSILEDIIDQNIEQYKKNKIIQKTIQSKTQEVFLKLDNHQNDQKDKDPNIKLKEAKSERFFEINSNNHQKTRSAFIKGKKESYLEKKTKEELINEDISSKIFRNSNYLVIRKAKEKSEKDQKVDKKLKQQVNQKNNQQQFKEIDQKWMDDQFQNVTEYVQIYLDQTMFNYMFEKNMNITNKENFTDLVMESVVRQGQQLMKVRHGLQQQIHPEYNSQKQIGWINNQQIWNLVSEQKEIVRQIQQIKFIKNTSKRYIVNSQKVKQRKQLMMQFKQQKQQELELKLLQQEYQFIKETLNSKSFE